MRAGFSDKLRDRLLRPDPNVRLMADIIVTKREDVQNLKSEFDAGTQTPTGNITTFDDGSARLTATAGLAFSDTTDNAFLADLQHSFPRICPMFMLDPSVGSNVRLRKFRAKLTRQRVGGNPQFDGVFALQIYTITEFYSIGGLIEFVSVSPLLSPTVQVTADSMTLDTEVVEFDLLKHATALNLLKSVKVKVRSVLGGGIEDDLLGRYLIFFISVIPTTPAGATAVGTTNVGWAWDTAGDGDRVTEADGELWNCEFAFEQAGGRGGWRAPHTDPTKVLGRLHCELDRDVYPDPAVGFSDLEMDIDLGAPPTNDVELEFRDSAPVGTVSTPEVSDDNRVSYTEFADGDIIGKDNTPTGGKDLSAIAVQQTYDVRWRAKANTNRDTSPTLSAIGPRERQVFDVSNLIKFGDLSRWAVDPITLEASIGEARIHVIRDGVRDFDDLATQIASDNEFADIEIRLYVGESDLDRSNWGLIEIFRIDEREPGFTAELFTGVSVLEQLKGLIPPFDPVSNKRQGQVYRDVTLKAAIDDIVDVQASLPGRYRGQLLENTVDKVTKTLVEGDGLREASALAYIDGRAIIASQGRVKTVNLHRDVSSVEILDPNEIEVLRFDPGFRRRLPEYFIRFGFEHNDQQEFVGEVRAFNTPAFVNLGVARIDQEPTRPPEEVEKWIPQNWTRTAPPDIAGTPASSILDPPGIAAIDPAAPRPGSGLALRIPTFIGTGLMLASIRLSYRRPWLEVGDPISFWQEVFTGRDPITGRKIDSPAWVTGIIVEQYNIWGTEFLVWIRGYANIVTGTTNVEVVAINIPALPALIPTGKEEALENGDFEDGFAFWGRVTDVSKISIETTDVHKGAKSLKLEPGTGGINEFHQVMDSRDLLSGDYAKGRVQPGEVMRVRAAAKSVNSAIVELGFRKWDENKVDQGTDTVLIWTETSYTEKEANYTIPSGIYYLTPWGQVR